VTDKFTPAKRSEIMGRIKGRDTGPEKQVRSLLHRMGYRFRLHRKDLPGKPDIVLPGRHKIVFVHGCFWHGHADCPRAKRPIANGEFWNTKLTGNKARDGAVHAELEAAGWEILTVWQCEMRDREQLKQRLAAFVGPAKSLPTLESKADTCSSVI